MPMYTPHLRNLRVRLQERKDAVLRASAFQIESHLSTFLNFVSNQTVLRTLTEELKITPTQAQKDEIHSKLEAGSISYDANLPSDGKLRAAYLLFVCEYFIDTATEGNTWQKMRNVFRSSNDEDFDEFKDQFFLPLYSYYDERIDDQDLLLYLLTKYKHLSEWFDRDSMYELASSDTRHTEYLLDKHLRRFLVVEGVSNPFSTPSSPMGRADIVVNVDEEPLPLEVKIFNDENSYGRAYMRKGFNQALRYANDNHQPAGYLVVFNLTEKLLQFGQDSSADLFPKIEVQNKTIFVVVVNIHPIKFTASEEHKPNVILIEGDYLCNSEGPTNQQESACA